MSTKKNKSAKKESAKKSGNSSKGKNKSRSSDKKSVKPKKGKVPDTTVTPEPAAALAVTPPSAQRPPEAPPVPKVAAPSAPPSELSAASPIAASQPEVKTIEEKKPRVIKITEAPMRTTSHDPLASRPPSPFVQPNLQSGVSQSTIKPSDLKTLAATVKKVCANHPAFRPLKQDDLQNMVNKTHDDVTVKLDGRNVTLTQGTSVEEFKF